MKINTDIEEDRGAAVEPGLGYAPPLRMREKLCKIMVLGLAAGAGCGYGSIQEAGDEASAAWTEVQTQLQRRLDLIPGLVEGVAAAVDAETVRVLVDARSAAAGVPLDPGLLDDPEAFRRLQRTQDALGAALQRLLVVAGRHPDLQHSIAFRDVRDEVEATESRIAVARRRYLERAAAYNELVTQFPSSLTARYVLEVQVRPSFEVPPAAERPLEP